MQGFFKPRKAYLHRLNIAPLLDAILALCARIVTTRWRYAVLGAAALAFAALFIVCLLVGAVTVTTAASEAVGVAWKEAGPSLGDYWQSADRRLRQGETMEELADLPTWVVRRQHM